MKLKTAIRSRFASTLAAVTLALAALAVIAAPAQAASLAKDIATTVRTGYEHLCCRFCGCHHHHHGHEWCDGHEHFWCHGHH